MDEIKQDIVAKYPKEISDYFRLNGKLPDNFKIDDGFVCALEGEKYFIHTRAVLPLKAFDKGMGFGLWVEVPRDVFMEYVNIGENNEKYMAFKVEGILANEWAGFENMKGARVVVRAVSVEDKVYITEVLDINDPLFEIAIRTQTDDTDGIKRIRDLVTAYVNDPAFNKSF